MLASRSISSFGFGYPANTNIKLKASAKKALYHRAARITRVNARSSIPTHGNVGVLSAIGAHSQNDSIREPGC